MADRKFEFSNVASNYENMKKILGDPSVSDSIAGILHNIDEDMKNHVDVVDMAIYGDLGKQMLLNWENTSSTFGSFINNFDNWNKAVAMASGNYTEFVNKVQRLRDTNPLGMTSGGITEAYTKTGYYSDFDQMLVDTAAAYIGEFRAYNELGYYDTGRVALEKQRKVMAGVMTAVNVVSIALSAWGAGAAIKSIGMPAIKAGVKELGKSGVKSLFNGTVREAAEAAGKKVTKEVAEEAAEAAAKKVTKEVTEEAAEGVVKKAVDWDTLVKNAPGATKERVEYVNKLIKDGVITNNDDFLRFFYNNASDAGRMYGSVVNGGGSTLARNIAKGFDDGSAVSIVSELMKEGSEKLGGTAIVEAAKSSTGSVVDKVVAESVETATKKVTKEVTEEAVETAGKKAAQEATKDGGFTRAKNVAKYMTQIDPVTNTKINTISFSRPGQVLKYAITGDHSIVDAISAGAHAATPTTAKTTSPVVKYLSGLFKQKK